MSEEAIIAIILLVRVDNFLLAHTNREIRSRWFQVAAAKSDNVQTFSRTFHRFQFKSYARERARSFFFFQISRWNIVSFTIRDQVSVKFHSRNPRSSVRKNYLRTREACLPALSRERKKKSEKLKSLSLPSIPVAGNATAIMASSAPMSFFFESLMIRAIGINFFEGASKCAFLIVFPRNPLTAVSHKNFLFAQFLCISFPSISDIHVDTYNILGNFFRISLHVPVWCYFRLVISRLHGE